MKIFSIFRLKTDSFLDSFLYTEAIKKKNATKPFN